MAPIKRSGDQPFGVVVVEVGVGRSDLHAAYAVLYFGFDVIDELAVGAPLVDGFFAIVTPCSVMQFRNAANAVELAPDAPPKPPPPNEPAGRRLAHALKAALALGFEPKPPPGGVPPAPGAPPAPPVGRFPVGAVTPCDFRQLVNAALDAEDFDVADFAAEGLVVDVVPLDDEALLPQAAKTTPARAMPSVTTTTDWYLGRRRLVSLVSCIRQV
jgi:hypothetical protein